MGCGIIRHSRENGNPGIHDKTSGFPRLKTCRGRLVKPGMTAIDSEPINPSVMQDFSTVLYF
jgi:hypothetical protein